MKIIILSLLLVFTSCREVLVDKVNEQQSAILVSQLQGIGVNAERKQQGDAWKILVEHTNMKQALAYLANSDLLRQKPIDPDIPESSLIGANSLDKTRSELILAKMLQNTLLSLPGIIDARVHIYIPSESLLQEQKSAKESASVLLVRDINYDFDPLDVQSLVAGATGMNVDSVNVISYEKQDSKKFEVLPIVGESESLSNYWQIVFASVGLLLLILIILIMFLKKHNNLQRQLENKLISSQVH